MVRGVKGMIVIEDCVCVFVCVFIVCVDVLFGVDCVFDCFGGGVKDGDVGGVYVVCV